MLIVLSESLRASDLRPKLDPKARDALLNLSTAAYEGTHLLAGSRLLFGDLQQLTELGPIPTGRFKEASIRGAEALSLIATTPAMIRVDPCGSAPNAERHPDSGRVTFHLPLDLFAESSRLGRSHLLGEHSRDTFFYIALGEAVAARHKGLRCRLRGADGHGGATSRVFQMHIEQDECVLCIVDSDRAANDAPLGRTAADVVAHCDTALAAHRVALAHVLPCRELENLIPAALVLDALPSDPLDEHGIRVRAAESRLGLGDYAELKHLVRLADISEHFRRLTPNKRAELCLRPAISPALNTVCSLVWSFGMGSERGRT
jgi:hypothetical protein